MSGVTSEDAVEVLGEVLSGPVLAPEDRGYDEVRRIHNGLIDRHPAVIARCWLREGLTLIGRRPLAVALQGLAE